MLPHQSPPAGQSSSEEACETEQLRLQHPTTSICMEWAGRVLGKLTMQLWADMFGWGTTSSSSRWTGRVCILFFYDCMKFPCNCAWSSRWARGRCWEHLRAFSANCWRAAWKPGQGSLRAWRADWSFHLWVHVGIGAFHWIHAAHVPRNKRQPPAVMHTHFNPQRVSILQALGTCMWLGSAFAVWQWSGMLRLKTAPWGVTHFQVWLTTWWRCLPAFKIKIWQLQSVTKVLITGWNQTLPLGVTPTSCLLAKVWREDDDTKQTTSC